MRLETQRLLLRTPEPRDRDFYTELFADAEVTRYLGGTTRPPGGPGPVERMLGHWDRHGVGLLSVVHKEDDRIIGRVGYLLWDTERWVNAMHEELEGDLELEIGWTLARELWNRGYATEAAAACRDYAFGQLRRECVISLIASENHASIRVAEKIGETLEQRDIGGETFRFTVDLYSLGNRPAR